LVGNDLVKLDSSRRTVRFARAGIELDPGAIGKGYAVDRMAAVLRRAGVQAALVNAGHSSIYALGSPPESLRGWMLEIDNPDRGSVEKVFLKDESLSTSGGDQKFFEVDGRVYSHILDPRTGVPAQGVRAVSVVASTAVDTDVWSTAIFVNGLAWGSRSAPPRFAVYGCPTDDSCRWFRRK
jgi:thiamine biosynthesis lipoprotein